MVQPLRSIAFLAPLLLAIPNDDPVSAVPSREVGMHESAITQLAASPDGSVLITLAGTQLHGFDARKERLLWMEEVGYTGSTIAAIAANDDYTTYHFGYLMVGFRELKTGKSKRNMGVARMRHAMNSRTIALDARSRWVWMGSADGSLKRVAPSNPNSLTVFALDNGGVTHLALDSRSKTLAIGGRDGSVRFIDTKREKIDEMILEVPGGAVTALAMDPKGTLVLAGSESGNLLVWKRAKATQVHTLVEQGPAIVHVTVSHNGALVAAGDLLGNIRTFDLKTGELLETLESPHGKPVTGVAFVNKEKTLAASYEHPKLTLWSLPKR